MRFLVLPRSLGAVAMLLVAGCGQEVIAPRRNSSPDGQIRRAIYQPVDDTPLEALDPKQWSGATYAVEITHDSWSGTIDRLPVHLREKDDAYFAAWGKFASPDELPSTYIKPAPIGLPDGKLTVEYKQTDYGFVTEYDWRETLTDIVTLDDMRRAPPAVSRHCVALRAQVPGRRPGTAVRRRQLDGLVRHDGPRPVHRAHRRVFRGRHARPTAAQPTVEIDDGRRLLRYGLQLRDKNGVLLDNDRTRKQVAEFAAGILRQRLKRRDGAAGPRGPRSTTCWNGSTLSIRPRRRIRDWLASTDWRSSWLPSNSAANRTSPNWSRR